MKNSTFLLSMAAVLAAFAALLCAPAEAAAGARQGLSVCAGVIVPALFPFLVMAGLLNALGLPRLLAAAAGPLMGRLFGVSGAAAAPFVLGLTGGYPVGAACAADLVKRGVMDAKEGERVLSFCNNTGPAFILGAAGSGVFGSTATGALLYASHILAAVAVGLLFSIGRPRTPAPGPERGAPAASLAQALPEVVKSGVMSTLNICGFVVFFSVITAILDALGLFSGLAGWLSLHTGAELRFARAFLSGILELGSGVAAMRGLSAAPRNLALASFLLGFGGLSVHCQTLSAVDGTGMKTARHFAGRLLHGAISAAITLLLCSVFRYACA